jgi:hypothetical protein
LLAGVPAAFPQNTGTDPARRNVWGENTGWVDAGPAGGGVVVHYYEGIGGWLSGRAWGENIGWILLGGPEGGPYANTSAANWGVNLAAGGELTGHAWGENVGWIRFEQTHGRPSIQPLTGVFAGHAWGENTGWLSFHGSAPDFGVRTLAFDTQPQGTPNWWLDHHGVTEAHDAGDGVPASAKYVMDADPNLAGDYLRITSVTNAPAQRIITLAPTSPRRYYTLLAREELTSGAWVDVPGRVARPGVGGAQAMTDSNESARTYYRVRVTVTP